MKQFLFLLLTFCLLSYTSCSVPEDKGTPKPDTLLTMSEMQEMMMGICRLEAKLRVYESENNSFRDSLNIYGRQQLDSLLRQHHIHWTTWKANFNYYMTRKSLADTLMARVTDNLAKEETVKNEALRQTIDTSQKLIIPSEATWDEVILF